LSYDSAIEENFHQQYPNLIYHADNHKHYPFTFFDDDGEKFKAAPDFYCNERNLVIELKGFQLNNVKNKSASKDKLQTQLEFNGDLKPYDKLRYGFNHSIYKQGAVNRTISASNYQYKFLLVFTDNTKLSAQSKNKMIKEQIDWCYVKEWENYQCAGVMTP